MTHYTVCCGCLCCITCIACSCFFMSYYHSMSGQGQFLHLVGSKSFPCFLKHVSCQTCWICLSGAHRNKIDINFPTSAKVFHKLVELYLCLCSVGSDDFLVVHARDDFAALHGTTPYTHSTPGTPINMPWLGGLQTGRGASVVSSTFLFECDDYI